MRALPRPLVDADIEADLIDEADYLARTLGQPQVRTAGAAGILNRVAPSTVWIVGEVDIDALAREIAGCDPHPELMIPVGEDAITDAFEQRGWQLGHVVERLRCDLAGFARNAPPPEVAVTVRPARRTDLPSLRALHVQAFDDEASAHYLPDSVLDIPGLEILVGESTTEAHELFGTAGIRLRHEGALLFGLATALARRRRGVATLVVAECLAWAVEQGADYVVADVDTPVPLLWPRLGFRAVSSWRRCTRHD
jgi:GNAT superfamily N-acetyltransferase